jgi:hypothetical protein
MRDDIVLIGPLSAGKTSVALYLSERLSLLYYPMDRIKWYYRFKNGYDIARGTKILRTYGFAALLKYASPFFSLKDIENFLNEFSGGILDFGASQSFFDDDNLLAEASRILQPFRNIVLLLPSPNLEESIEVLSQRIRERYREKERTPEVVKSYVDVNRQFVLHKSNSLIAKYVVYTGGKNIEETGEEIINVTGYTVSHKITQNTPVGIEGSGSSKPGQGGNFLPPFA